MRVDDKAKEMKEEFSIVIYKEEEIESTEKVRKGVCEERSDDFGNSLEGLTLKIGHWFLFVIVVFEEIELIYSF